MDSDPTSPDPDFQKLCQSTLTGWIEGESVFRDALATLTGLYKQAVAEKHLPNQAVAQRMLGFMQGYRGNLNACIEHYDRARSLYDQLGRPHDVMVMDLNRGIAYRQRGDFHQALSLYRSIIEQASTLGVFDIQAKTLTNEALLLIPLKRLRQAKEALIHVRELADKHYEPQGRNWPTILCEMYFAEALIQIDEGQAADGWQAAMSSLEVATVSGQVLHRGYANRTLAVVLDALGISPDPEYQGDPDSYFSIAINAFREMRAEAEMAQTIYLHGISLGKRGQSLAAARKFQQALVIFTRLGMTHDAAETAKAQSLYG
jgi:tetratricopeptide (TPR) repeat protein